MSPVRDPDVTRQKILEVAAEEMRVHGYKAASLSEILSKAEVSKGALYHHFANKQELGYAVFEELYAEECLSRWRGALAQEDVLDGICHMLSDFEDQCSDEDIACGCPVNTISQEMAAVDDGFQKQTFNMYQRQARMIEEALLRSSEQGLVKSGIDCEQTALFIVAGFQGIASMMKASRSRETLHKLHAGLADYVQHLRA
ncbi:TetR/AcrR family transcriptional regulator [Pseudomaricurvus alkylphenolicus]|uniref:TetR/AcrR family transcriptional regulator n=1 Tax=Pseudomaricurvus alkylphenolicus TaxID=1306991 RepID=UPI00142432D1|nr:TetR/AcrR family transcriptional regulator [Pseudomaricurvus alkylphenolicus]NIB38108.1 TetR/AcrR family transcriptional regulator [Pseudomaricurvus alkylphenolicus]